MRAISGPVVVVVKATRRVVASPWRTFAQGGADFKPGEPLAPFCLQRSGSRRVSFARLQMVGSHFTGRATSWASWQDLTASNPTIYPKYF